MVTLWDSTSRTSLHGRTHRYRARAFAEGGLKRNPPLTAPHLLQLCWPPTPLSSPRLGLGAGWNAAADWTCICDPACQAWLLRGKSGRVAFPRNAVKPPFCNHGGRKECGLASCRGLDPRPTVAWQRVETQLKEKEGVGRILAK